MSTEAASGTGIAEIPVETVKVFDIGQGKFIEKPVDKEPTPSSENAKLDSQIDKKPDNQPPVEVKKDDPPPAEQKTAEQIEKEKVEAQQKAEAEKAKSFEPGSFIKEKYGKFGVQSEEDLEKVLQATDEVTKKYSELEGKYKELESKPAYRSEQEQKIAEFLKVYPVDKFGDGLQTSASIMAMDVANVSGRKAMEEAYILSKPHFTREEAQEKFAEIYSSKFIIDKESFESDDDYNKKKRSIELDLKDEEAQARKVLSDKQKELKVEKKPEDTKPAAEKPFDIPADTLTRYNGDVQKFLNPEKNKSFDRLNYMSDDGKDLLLSVVLEPEMKESVSKFLSSYVANPKNYSKEGKIDNFTPSELAKMFLRVEYGDWIDDQVLKGAKTMAEKIKAEQIASVAPDKKSSGTGEGGVLSIEDQFKKMAADAKAARESTRK